MVDEVLKIDRRALVASILAGGLALPFSSQAAEYRIDPSQKKVPPRNNPLLWAVAWSETAAEFGALCHQAFNLARLRLDQAIEKSSDLIRPLAIIVDVDNTIVHASGYWGYLINEGIDFFDDKIWDRWIPQNLVTLVPGAKEFLIYCEQKDVEIFYVTSRNQGPRTYDLALKQLQNLDLPFADSAHLTVFRETSDKTSARDAISGTHELVLLLGDNLNDYKRDYYVNSVTERFALMERDRKEIGDRFIILPNPTDGHWVKAIFGESEPAASDENRDILVSAATRTAWDGKSMAT